MYTCSFKNPEITLNFAMSWSRSKTIQKKLKKRFQNKYNQHLATNFHETLEIKKYKTNIKAKK